MSISRQLRASTTTGGSGSSGSTGTPASIVTQYGGVAQRASFSPDGSTIYIVGTNKLYVYNTFTGWSTETLDATNGTPSAAACPANGATGSDANTAYNVFCSPDLSLAVPQFGAFVSGQNTTSRGYCPDTRLNPIDNYPSAVPAGAVGYNFTADHLASTTDGKHVISATASPTPQLIDSNVLVPTNAGANCGWRMPHYARDHRWHGHDPARDHQSRQLHAVAGGVRAISDPPGGDLAKLVACRRHL